MSRGSLQLEELIKAIFGSHIKLHSEYHVGNRLRLDFYSPDLKVGFEFHGRQHSEFVEHYHGDAAGFELSKRRDQTKIDLCLSLGIAVVAFWHDEELTEELVRTRVAQAIDELPKVKPQVEEEPDWKKKQKQRAKEYRQRRYQWLKQMKQSQSQ